MTSEKIEIALLILQAGNFKIFKNVIGQFNPLRPPKHMITSTNLTVLFKSSRHDPGQREKPNLDFFFHFFEVPQKAL